MTVFISEPLTRLMLAVLLGAALFAAYRVVTYLALARARRGSRSTGLLKGGMPGVVYFTTPDCAVCKAAQRPALAALKQRLDDQIQVIEIDAQERPDLARQWSVLSVPTTFIVDRDGRPRRVNHGFASADKLLGQLQQVV